MAAVNTSPRFEVFLEAVTKLANLDLENRQFHCEPCRITFCELQEKAQLFLSTEDDKVTFSVKQLEFARAIIMGRACSARKGFIDRSVRRQIDPTEQVTVQCVHNDWTTETRKGKDGKFIKGKDGKRKQFSVPVRCSEMITGTRAEIGQLNTRCPNHQA